MGYLIQLWDGGREDSEPRLLRRLGARPRIQRRVHHQPIFVQLAILLTHVCTRITVTIFESSSVRTAQTQTRFAYTYLPTNRDFRTLRRM